MEGSSTVHMAAPAGKMPAPWLGVYWLFGGSPRKRRNVRDMTKTLIRIKDVVERADAP